jgi:hypothetical protein
MIQSSLLVSVVHTPNCCSYVLNVSDVESEYQHDAILRFEVEFVENRKRQGLSIFTIVSILIRLFVKILRHSPFDACLQILGGQKTSIDERYNSFFIGKQYTFDVHFSASVADVLQFLSLSIICLLE